MQAEIDTLEETGKLGSAGPHTKSLMARGAGLIREFQDSHGFDPESQWFSLAFYAGDARERALILPVGCSTPTPEVFSLYPCLVIPPELDTLSIMRSAASEGYASPLLESFEEAARLAGRD